MNELTNKTFTSEEVQSIIKECIKQTLYSEGYSPSKAQVAINWAWSDIQYVLKKRGVIE